MGLQNVKQTFTYLKKNPGSTVPGTVVESMNELLKCIVCKEIIGSTFSEHENYIKR
jgi:hypothetical protein